MFYGKDVREISEIKREGLSIRAVSRLTAYSPQDDWPAPIAPAGRLRIHLAPKVVIIDEMEYLPLDDLGATIFFQLVSARYERGSIILASNKSYGEWGSIVGDPSSPQLSACCTIRLRSTSAARVTG